MLGVGCGGLRVAGCEPKAESMEQRAEGRELMKRECGMI